MQYTQFSIKAYIKDEKEIKIWHNNYWINREWKIDDVIYHSGTHTMNLRIKHISEKYVVLIFIQFVLSDRKQTMLKETILYKLGEVEMYD